MVWPSRTALSHSPRSPALSALTLPIAAAAAAHARDYGQDQRCRGHARAECLCQSGASADRHAHARRACSESGRPAAPRAPAWPGLPAAAGCAQEAAHTAAQGQPVDLRLADCGHSSPLPSFHRDLRLRETSGSLSSSTPSFATKVRSEPLSFPASLGAAATVAPLPIPASRRCASVVLPLSPELADACSGETDGRETSPASERHTSTHAFAAASPARETE